MEAGAKVWFTDVDGDDAWLLAEVISRTVSEVKLAEVNNPQNTHVRPRVKVKGNSDEPEEVKYENVELANTQLSDAERAEGRDDDLITLPHLHEPAILHAVGERFHEGKIYTWTGPVLIAVNPFQRLPLYTTAILEAYRRAGLLKSQGMGLNGSAKLGPHVYSVADRSYRQMMSEKRKSQSILISGESGAGKTESTKIVMLYLCTLGTANAKDDGKDDVGDLSIMERVLQSNPILEAFGNARTLRNDNSSRFGKFIELGFSRAGFLLGAKMQTYLLEKVRLGFHASGERNYHIFYQLLRGASDEQKKRYGFHDGETHGLELVNYFHYTGQGGAPQLREFTDEDGLKYTLRAMASLGWDDKMIDHVLSLVAGLLHLGQMNFNGIENEGGQEIAEVADEKILRHAAQLLGVDVGQLRTALTERVMITRGDAITIQLAPAKAIDSRDALAKTIYGALFLWVVSEVNRCITWENDNEVRSSIGVLDIFGFECFAVNSFEQLCINFTNEALQQQFNRFIFKMEQAEYENEKINWAFISFPDNQDCLDTIQSKPTGVLAMLDDECRLGSRGSDKNWADRLYKLFLPEKGQVESENSRFSATPIQKGRSIFCVRHFAGIVEYTATTGFLEKNKDEIPVTAQTLFELAPSQLIKNIYAVQKKETEERTALEKPGARSGPAKSKTVGQQFKEQLAILMEKVESTEPHYIRCLKPNDAAKPKMLTRKRLTEQLRYGGVLEAVRVARMGYPVRLDHDAFFKRYRVLLPSISDEKLPWSMDGRDPQKLCVHLVAILLEQGVRDVKAGVKSVSEKGISRAEKVRRMQYQPPPMTFPTTDIQLGVSKVFLRKPPHDALESHRVFHQNASVTLIQSWVRGMHRRIRFLILCEAALMTQRFYRGCVGRARWWRLREAVAGVLLTKAFRMLICQRRFNRAKRGTIRYQSLYRGYDTRKVLSTIKIQTHVRMYKRKAMYCTLRSATVALQCALRCRVAKRALAALKYEQKDIGKLKQNNEQLKNEMASLKAMLAAQAKGDANREESQKELSLKNIQIAALEKRIAELEIEIEHQKNIVKRLEDDLEIQKCQSVKDTENIRLLQIQHQNVQVQEPASPRVHRHERLAQSHPPPEHRSPAANVQLIVHTVVDSKVLAEHKAYVATLEGELEAEKKRRRVADGEIIKLRAAMSGVTLNDADVDALLTPLGEQSNTPGKINLQMPSLVEETEVESETEVGEGQRESLQLRHRPRENGAIVPASQETEPEITGAEERKVAGSRHQMETPPASPIRDAAAKIETQNNEALEMKRRETTAILEAANGGDKLGTTGSKGRHVLTRGPERQDSRRSGFIRSPSEYFPLIRRGFANTGEEAEKEEEEVMAVGWKVDVTSRKEREIALRDDVRRFEVKMKNFYATLEQGIDVTMWQLSGNTELGPQAGGDDFTLKATSVQLKLNNSGELLVQAMLTFSTKGGYLSKALGRNKIDRLALDPLSLHEILEVKAGCVGYDHTELPSAGKTKSKGDNTHSSLFLTLKAAPTPLATFRSYFLKFKSRAARNDLMLGLRGVLADLQIFEGVGISTIHVPQDEGPKTGGRKMPGSTKQTEADGIFYDMENGDDDIHVPLADVNKAINKEREAYDRLLLMLLQGTSDLKEKEDEMLLLRGRLETVVSESQEKDRVQTNDSKLIMQLSKKLETLLMDNEDLRDQNDRLNNRLVAVECEKMNLMS